MELPAFVGAVFRSSNSSTGWLTAPVMADKSLAVEQAPLSLAVVAVDDNRLGRLPDSIRDMARAIRDASPR